VTETKQERTKEGRGGKREHIQVIGLGQACVDYLGRVPCFPEENEKVEILGLTIQCGGPASTAMVALARWRVPVSFIGAVSDDPFGSSIRENLIQQRVDIACLKIRPGCTSQFAFIGVSANTGNRTIFWTRGSVPPLRAEEIDLNGFASARVLHLDGLMMDASLEAADQARRLGMTVVLDAGTSREGSGELVSRVDVLIASERFAAGTTGQSMIDEGSLRKLRKIGPRDVVITMGAKGSIGLGKDGLIRQAAFPVKAVDTTGAGDVYHGAYIYGLLKEWPMGECMRFASAAAAIKCLKIGAQAGIPRISEVKALLERRHVLRK
jgi:sulfofructose kinase